VTEGQGLFRRGAESLRAKAGRRVCGVGAPYSGGDGEGGAVFSGVNLTAVGIMQCDRSK